MAIFGIGESVMKATIYFNPRKKSHINELNQKSKNMNFPTFRNNHSRNVNWMVVLLVFLFVMFFTNLRTNAQNYGFIQPSSSNATYCQNSVASALTGGYYMTSDFQNVAAVDGSTGSFLNHGNDIQVGWYSNGPGVVNALVTAVNVATEEVTISGQSFQAGQHYTFSPTFSNTYQWYVNATQNNSGGI
jgi:hypothetical protein